jgi:chorismate mutase/prephenate dehydrogenase
MGRRLAFFFRRRGFRVLIHDPAGALRGFAPAGLDAARDADVVVVAASLERTAAALEAVLDRKPRGLVLDIASVKAPLLPAIGRARAEGVAIASVHPMFGPEVRSFRGSDLIVCDCGDAAAARRARALFAGAGLKIRTIPLAEHDPWNAKTLGLAHFVALAAAGALAELGVDLDGVDGRASTSFRHLLTLVEPILDQEPALTRAIQASNPQSDLVAGHLAEQVEAFRRLLFEKDLTALTSRLVACRRALRPRS